MKNIKHIAILLMAMMLTAFGQDITPGYTFHDGQTLTASQLAQLVSLATINSAFITRQTANNGSPSGGDTFIMYSASGTAFRKLTANELIYNNTNIYTLKSSFTNLNPDTFILFYDQTNGILGKISVSNLLVTFGNTVSSNIFLTYGAYSTPIDASLTNNQVRVLVYDTNGVPKYITYSNLMQNAWAWNYTNGLEPYAYKQLFLPWTLYGTNSATNQFALYTNFPITSLTVSNTVTTTNVPTLLSSDTIPIKSGQQGTNTTIDINTLGSYFATNLLQTTGEFPITNRVANSFSVSHSLGSTPSYIRWVLVCKTNEVGYSVGDEVDSATLINSGDNSYKPHWGASTTNVFWEFYSTGLNRFQLGSKNGSTVPQNLSEDGTSRQINNWKLKGYFKP